MKILKLILLYIILGVSGVVVVLSFITATSYQQLAAGIVLYPIYLLFVYLIVPKKVFRKQEKSQQMPEISNNNQITPQEIKTTTVEQTHFSVSDADKRVFLKLIGGTGVFLLILSIFNKKTGNMFFKNFPGDSSLASGETSDNKNNSPSQNQPMDGYRIADIDDDVISYYGFTNLDGAWYMMKIDTATGTFRYAKGSTDFPGNWKNRKNLKYDYFNKVF